MNHITHKNLILVGMPAVGKSTLGVILAKRLGFAFTDTDLLIQTGEGDSLRNIIDKVGIEEFCDLEAMYVKRLATQKTVIATGGSVVYRESAMAHLHKMGCIVFLDIQLNELTKRLKAIDARGVVHTPGQTIDQIYAERRPLYQRYADMTVACTRCSPEKSVNKVLAALL